MRIIRQLALQAILSLAASAQIGNIVVTSAASFQPGMPPPGSIGTVFCTGLAVSGLVISTMLPVPRELAGVTVTVGSVPAPLFAVADLGGYQQINFQVPLKADFRSDGSVDVVIAQGSTQAVATAKCNYYVQPGHFFRIGGTQYGAFQHSGDYSLVTDTSPAKPGETIIAYLTGLPTATNPPSDGQPAPASPLSVVPQYNTADMISQLSLQVGGIGVYDPPPINGDSTGMNPIPFIGLAPGAVGLYQINFILPQNTPSGHNGVYLVATHCAGTPAGVPHGPGNCYTNAQWYYSQSVVLPVH